MMQGVSTTYHMSFLRHCGQRRQLGERQVLACTCERAWAKDEGLHRDVKRAIVALTVSQGSLVGMHLGEHIRDRAAT
jgi:hypothetical protein